MVDSEFKKKIANTFSNYEKKCNSLQSEIVVLRETIDQLSVIPQGMFEDLDNHLLALREEVHKQEDSDVIQQRLQLMTEMVSGLQRKKENARTQIKKLCRKSIELFSRLDTEKAYQQKFMKIESQLDDDSVSEKLIVNNFLKQLDGFIFHVAASLSPKLGELLDDEDESVALEPQKSDDALSLQINDGLRELLQNLGLPASFSQTKEQLNKLFSQPLNPPKLISIIDTLSDLVIKAFHLEQDRFKGFVSDLTKQLASFDHFLSNQVEMNNSAQSESNNLQAGISKDLSAIKEEIDSNRSLDDISIAIFNHLGKIGKKLETFRETEKERLSNHQREITKLKKQIELANENAAELQNTLTLHEELMNLDSLTALPNRAAFDEHFNGAYHRWQRGFGDLVIAIGDLDNFKQINDTYGHLAGDKVLKRTAGLLKKSLRTVDFIARYGGEEFVIVFEQTPLKDAHVRLDKLRQDLDELDFSYRNQPVDITISFGLAQMTDDDDLEAVFTRADRALYQAKNGGRNKVCSE